jgi:hypothetical protein
MSTWFQTAHVIFPHSTLIFHTIRQRPIAPVETVDSTLGISRQDGTILFWYPDQSVVEIATNGMKTMWYSRPTMNTAIHDTSVPSHTFVQFHSDGSTTAKYNTTNYYWSPPFQAYPEVGETFCTPTTRCTDNTTNAFCAMACHCYDSDEEMAQRSPYGYDSP